MLSDEDATALVAGSRLFDERWYATQVAEDFPNRTVAAEHWVTRAPRNSSPHPLFEPLWLYPGARWRHQAPDPLSFYLSRPSNRGRSPHPLYDESEHGHLEDWLEHHDPAEILPASQAPSAEIEGDVWVDVPTDDLALAVRWLRHLDARSPEVIAAVRPRSIAARRVLGSVCATLTRARVVDWVLADIVVTIDPGVTPPRWSWLPPLLAALERPGVVAAQSLLLADDFTVAAPVLVGHPVSAVERLDGRAIPTRFPGVEAVRSRAKGDRVLVTSSWVRRPKGTVARGGPAWDALEAEASRVSVVEGVPCLRWSIDIAAGAAPIGRGWGDWHFARSLADALERRGQRVEIDHPETRGRATRAETDVVLTLRGLQRVVPPELTVNLLWVISHPDEVSDEELADYDVAYAASDPWAAERGIETLLQCTDTTRFRPLSVTAATSGRPLFVGNARGGMRPVVAAAQEAGVDVRVIGRDWAALGVVADAESIGNADLPAAYAAAPVVLNDHHHDMRIAGFVSNRVFDVLAVGGRLLSDDVAGLREVLGVDLPVWRTPDDVARLTRAPYDAFPDDEARRTLAEHVVAHHSFDARAATLLEAALQRLDRAVAP